MWSRIRADRPVRDGANAAGVASDLASPILALTTDQLVLDLLRQWTPVLAAAGVAADRADHAARRAIAHRSVFARELVLGGAVDERELFRSIAGHLGLGFQQHVEAGSLVIREAHERTLLRAGLPNAPVRILREDGSTVLAIADYGIDLLSWRERLRRLPGLAARIVLVPPSELRRALVARSEAWMLRDAVHRLYLGQREMSAHDVTTPWQGLLAGIVGTLLPVMLIAAPYGTILALNVLGTIAFTSCVVLRLLALRAARPLRLPPLVASDPSRMPVYSVLVALHREKEVVSQLLVALGKLQWPRSRLEIKLVCEADDTETLEAIEAHRLHPCIEIVRVPPANPRTKPKALAYALPICSGELVTLYDAEDRPHPMQLIEAWQRFSGADESLACLQAPLVVTNDDAGLLARLFAFEYAGLFRGLLPWLAGMGTVVPLGGTSNHFRRSALAAVGGWDPFNVTEDADLGLRLRRRGYRVGTLSLPTHEDAPEAFSVWRPQRTRWFKGWMQTWLVHMRSPARLAAELGPGAFAVAQILFAGTVVSALIHPLCLLSLGWVLVDLASADALYSWGGLIAMLGALNVATGYVAFILIGLQTLAVRERKGIAWVVMATPLLWLLLSVAAWRAIWELIRAPHRWNKTPHKPAEKPRWKRPATPTLSTAGR